MTTEMEGEPGGGEVGEGGVMTIKGILPHATLAALRIII
jgi:hypothetical protein